MSFLTRPRTIIVLILILIIFIVAAQNNRPVQISFLVWRAWLDGLLLFILIFLVGMLSGALLFWGWRRGRNS